MLVVVQQAILALLLIGVSYSVTAYGSTYSEVENYDDPMYSVESIFMSSTSEEELEKTKTTADIEETTAAESVEVKLQTGTSRDLETTAYKTPESEMSNAWSSGVDILLDTSVLHQEITKRFKKVDKYAIEISSGQGDLINLPTYSYLFLALVYFLANKDLTFSSIVLGKMSSVEPPIDFEVKIMCQQFKFPSSDVTALFQFIAGEKALKLPKLVEQNLLDLAEEYEVAGNALKSEDALVVSWLYEKGAILADLIKDSTLGMAILERLAEDKFLDNMTISNLEEIIPEGESLLRLASKSGRVQLLERLMHSGFNLSAVDRYNKTVLEYAVEAGQVDLVKYLVAKGFELDGRYSSVDGGSLLHIAALNGRREMVEYLLSRRLDADAPNARGQTPLYLAASRRHEELVRMLRNHGADINNVGLFGETLLHIAAKFGDVNATEILINNGAEVDSDNFGMTPLYRAAQFRQKGVMAVLLEHNADRNYGVETRNRLIHIAARNNHSQVIEALLDLGVRADLRGSWDFTALHWAARVGFPNVIQLLLDRGADIEQRIDIGRTPLHEAAFWGQVESCRTLIANRANVMARDNSGRLPSQLAKASEHFALYLMLKEFENKQ